MATQMQDDKLYKFQQAVFSEADKQAEEILSDIDRRRQEELDKAHSDALEMHFHDMQARLGQIKQDCRREVSKADLEAKRELLRRREELSGRVFDAVAKRLREFTASPEYPDYLIGRLKSAFRSCPADDSVLYLTPADKRLEPRLKEEFGSGLTVRELQNDETGGFILKNEALGIAIDETLDALLAGQREYFNQLSGLKVE